MGLRAFAEPVFRAAAFAEGRYGLPAARAPEFLTGKSLSLRGNRKVVRSRQVA